MSEVKQVKDENKRSNTVVNINLVDLVVGLQVDDLILDDVSLPSNKLDAQSDMQVNSRNEELIRKRYAKKEKTQGFRSSAPLIKPEIAKNSTLKNNNTEHIKKALIRNAINVSIERIRYRA
jgi:hypothetical protein